LDLEEKSVEAAKTVAETEGLMKRLSSKEGQLDKDLVATEAEIVRFQTEKAKALDLLNAPVPLKASQLCCFVDPNTTDESDDAESADTKTRASATTGTTKPLGSPAGSSSPDALGMMRTLSMSTSQRLAYSALTKFDPFGTAQQEEVAPYEGPFTLVADAPSESHALFPRDQLDRLKRRIGELGTETEAERKGLSDLHKAKKALERERVAAEASVKAQEAKNEGLQMLRFGQIVDMKMVEEGDSGVRKRVGLSRKLNAVEADNDRGVAREQRKVKALKESLLRVTQENTELLSRIADLSGKQFQLEKELNGGGGAGAVVGDNGPSVRSEVEERNKLVALVKLQAKEVEALKAEINLLRRKGGHVYVPPPQQGAQGAADSGPFDASGAMMPPPGMDQSAPQPPPM